MFKTTKGFINQYWKTIVWFIVIFFLSTMQASDVPKLSLFTIPHFDKIVHFSMYSILVTVWFIDYCIFAKLFHNRMTYTIILGSIFYGLLMELIQKTLIQTRDGDALDALANISGGISAFLLFRYFPQYRKLIIRLLKLIS